MISKSKSLPSNLSKLYSNIVSTISFNNFNTLKLYGQQKLLTYGQYSTTKGTKENRIKLIKYTYSKL